MARGRLITFEGGEGAGKSTHARELAGRLEELGLEVVRTREPGGSAGGEAIRALLVEGTPERWSATTEALLMYAARRDHIERVIEPALARGATVVCDRFADSTRAYQGAAGGAPAALLDALEETVLDSLKPDLTFILDAPVSIGLSRAAHRQGGEDRFEAKGEAFHVRLREAFLAIAAAEPERCVVIETAGGAEEAQAAIWRATRERLGL